MRKHSIKIGMALMAVLALSAFAAAGAQAETKVPIKVLGNSTTLLATVAANILLGVLLIPALNAEIHCERGSIVAGAHIAGGHALGKVLFEDCLKVNSITPLEPLPCFIVNGGANKHITATALIWALLHKGTVYYIAEGTAGAAGEELFATIEFEKEKGCTLPSPVKIKGLYAFEGPQGEVKEGLLTPGNETLQNLLIPKETQLKFGVSKALLDPGIAHVTLSGEHLGCTWGAI